MPNYEPMTGGVPCPTPELREELAGRALAEYKPDVLPTAGNKTSNPWLQPDVTVTATGTGDGSENSSGTESGTSGGGVG